MTVEAATYVSQLDSTKPSGTDAKSEGDDHIRLLKSTLTTTFPNVSGIVTSSHTDLNSITTKASKTGDTHTGTHDFTGGTILVPTPTTGDNSTKGASTAFVATTLAGYAGFYTSALSYSIATGTAVTLVAGQAVLINNALTVTVTLPATPSIGQVVAVIVANGRSDNVIARNGNNIMALAQDMTLTTGNVCVTLVYTDSTNGWRII